MAWKRLFVSGLFFALGILVLIVGGNITGGVTGVADWQDSYYIFFAALLFFVSGFFLLISLFFDKSLKFDAEEPPITETKPLSSYKNQKYSGNNKKYSDD